MKMVRYAHACVRFETSGGVVVIDPGAFSGTEPLADADVVLITHDHFDHVVPDTLRDFLAKRPGARIYGPPSLSGTLEDIPFTPVRHGATFDAVGLSVQVFGEKHAVIHPSYPVIENVGFLFDGIFHPGDALTVPEAPVRTLLAPVCAPWMKLGEGADYINAVRPERVHPIHDALLSDIGIHVTDSMLPPLTETEYVRLGVGESVEI